MISSARHALDIILCFPFLKSRHPLSRFPHVLRPSFPISSSSQRPTPFSSLIVSSAADMGSLSDHLPPLHYPLARRDYSVVDDYHGVLVSDPYRWLENPDSEETKAFVEAQAALTDSVLAECGERERLREQITKLFDHPRYETPFKRGGKYFYFHNSGLQAQSVLYVQSDLDSEAEVLLDPNVLSEDGTVALSNVSISRDGKYLAYGLSLSGSDWVTIKVMRIADKMPEPDTISWVKFSSISWTHDGNGFFYGRYPAPKEGDDVDAGTETDINLNHQLCYHFLGTDQSEDVLCWKDPENPKFTLGTSVTEDGKMELQNTPMTVQLGQGARIQLANAVINTGSSGATIQFGSVDFPAVVARTAATSAYGTDFERPARRPHSAETSARSAHLSAPRVTVTQEPRRRISVFERISQPKAPATKRIVTGGRISVVTANTTTLPTGSPASGNNNVETSSSGGRLTRRQRRKRNAELRAQQQFSTHPSNVPAQELEAAIPTQNGFSNLKWVKRNSSTGELKKSFWEQRREVPTPPKKKEPESLSARIYRVLKTVKERGLTKRKIQRPLRVETRRAPPKERLSVTTRIRERRYTPRGEHRGVTPERRVQGSTAERSRWKGKQIWRPMPHRDEERKEREIDLGVTSGVASRRSAPNSRDRRRWVQKKTHDDACYNCRHLGESSRGSRRSPTPPKEEVNFDRSPRVEEILLPNKEPEIQWRRRSEIRLLGEGKNMEENMKEEYLKDEDYMEDEQEEMNDTINMEVVYMVRHVEVEYDDGEDDGDWQPHPQQEYQHQHEAGSIADGGNRSQGEQEADEVEENHSDDENITLANIRRQMRRQMRAKDREISQLNEKMTEMMAQMTAMMRMMQRTAVAGAIPNPPADPPNLRMPQVSGVRGARRGEADSTFFSRTDKGKQVVYNLDKGKQPMQHEEKPKQGGGERPRQNMGTGDRTFPSLKDKMNKEYSFKRESVAKLFRQESTRVVTSSSVPPIDDRKNDKKPVQEEKWETAVSKKTAKMLKQLEGVPGVKWKSPTEPVLNLKGLSNVQASTSKQHLSQASSSKPGKSKFFKKKTKLKKPKEKKTVTQKVIDSLDEYYQTVRQPIKLADFMSELKIGETEEDGDTDFLPTEVCRVISVAPGTSINEKYVKKEAPEACMMVLPMDCSSEEDLYFPEEGESDPDIASQMEHVNLGGSDTDENDVTPTKSQRVSRSKTKGRKEVEYSNDDYDYDSIYTNTVHGVFSRRIDNLSISDSVLVVTRIPLQYFKEIIPRKVHDVEELTTFYVPPLRKASGPASLFYSIGRLDEDVNRDWFCNPVDSGELVPTRFPRYNTRNIQRMLRKRGKIRSSKQQVHLCLSLWYRTVYEDAQYFIPKKLRPSSSLEVKAPNLKVVQRPKQRAEGKPVGRKKAMPTLPKPVIIPKERKHVPHLGSDTDENDVTPTKSQRVSRSKTKGRKEVEYSNDDYDYDSIYTNTVHGVFSRRIDNLSISDSVLVVTRIPLQYFKEIIPRKYVTLAISEGCDPVNKLYYCDLSTLSGGLHVLKGSKDMLPFVKLVDNFEASYDVVANNDTEFTFLTNKESPRYKLVRVDLNKPEIWSDVLPEDQNDVLESAYAVNGNQLLVCYLSDVKYILQIRDLKTGQLLHNLPIDIGTVTGISGKRKDAEIFIGFTSFLTPGIIYKCNLSSEAPEMKVFREVSVPGFNRDDFYAEQVFVSSKDGTKIPMFIVSRKDIILDGSHPTLLYGYGGFNISLTPTFSVGRIVLARNLGFVFCIVNIRGGGEYGEEWHKSGSLSKKQNCFDDFIAASEFLISTGYTNSGRLCIEGGSNGGLLIAACINQRPDLFGCAIAHVGVMDMLRFHKFTIGHAWTSDYGCSDKKDEFQWLFKYSPLHNVKRPWEKSSDSSSQYPPTMLLTADHDDRVVPLHSLKLLATMQYILCTSLENSPQKNPIIARIDRKAGHGAGRPTQKMIDEAADRYGFAAKMMGVSWND
ncbi:hypothetical protein M5K25_016759 [Dendrobium thyrsiflorum]|uniref:prolyl oligopeptidase n=1 Tax=Dendrobium thyrsiflorum TaxID=117978 RepID=A0ABD0UKI7_DENTH